MLWKVPILLPIIFSLIAYFNSSLQDLALKFMRNAKDTGDATLGSNHVDSLRTSHALSMTYGRMGRFPQSVVVHEKIVEGVRGLISSEQELLGDVVTILNVMKEGAIGSLIGDTPQFNYIEVLYDTM